MKKIIAMTLVMMMIVAVFAGCGKKPLMLQEYQAKP